MGTLAGKTYEVHVDQGGGRWTVVDVHEARNTAIEEAQELVESKKYGGVRVISESDRTGVETIFEEINPNFDNRPVTIVAINSAPLCSTFDDYFGLESRRTIGRVLRNHLERQGVSALEMMYDATQIRLLENNDILFPQFIQQIAAAQARGTDMKPFERADELYNTVTKVREKATSVASDDAGYLILKDRGISALIEEMEKTHKSDKTVYFIRHAFARYLRDGGDWNSKLKLLSELGVEGLSEKAVSYLDEIMAEILDGLPAVLELLAGQPDLATASRVLIQLSEGQTKAPPNALSCIEDVNAMIARLPLIWTKRVLLERVASDMASTKPLTREKVEQEREAFVLIVRDLTETAGIIGGARMCGAILQRARIAFSKGGENLTFPDAMTRITNLFPHRAARIGYLAELSLSSVATEHRSLVLSELTKVIDQLPSLATLVPTGSSHDTIRATVEELTMRLRPVAISWELRDPLNGAADLLLAKPDSVEVTRKAETTTDDEFSNMSSETPDQKVVPVGETLFEEGELGDEAYLIVKGMVEIFQRVGNKEHIIANLGKGEIIGEMSLIDNQPRMASARVTGDATLMVISKDSLKRRLQRLDQEDRVMRRLLDVLVNRLRGDAPAGA